MKKWEACVNVTKHSNIVSILLVPFLRCHRALLLTLLRFGWKPKKWWKNLL